MRLIGNKSRLLAEIQSVLESRSIRGGTFIDIFTGTASVARHFKGLGYRVIANDVMSACYTQAVAAVEISACPPFREFLDDHREILCSGAFHAGFSKRFADSSPPALDPFRERVERHLDASFSSRKSASRRASGVSETFALELAIHLLACHIPDREGLIYRNYSPGGARGRRYFREAHARKLDGILDTLRNAHRAGRLSREELHLLLVSVIDAADRRANISGTYGAYLKSWQSNTKQDLELRLPVIGDPGVGGHQVFHRDSAELIGEIEGDVLYIDPPYNRRQYAANYHVLEILAEYHRVEDLENYEKLLYGKTGLRPYDDLKSDFCVPRKQRKREGHRDVHDAMRGLLRDARVDHVLLSYNEEGLLTKEEIGGLLAEFSGNSEFDWKRGFREVEHQRFRSDRDRDAGADGGLSRSYRVLDGKERNRIGEWLFFASRAKASGRRARPRRPAAVLESRGVASSAATAVRRRPAASRGESMKPAFRSVKVLANPHHAVCAKAATRLIAELKGEGCKVTKSLKTGARPDLIVVLGGDGFLMESIRKLDYGPVPICGINFGQVGFLMNPRESLGRLSVMVRDGAFRRVEYPVLEARVAESGGEETSHFAFNDIVLERRSGQSIQFHASASGHTFNHYSGDGIIVATSGGSTAYNLAAGGPVVHPELPAMILTPLYPHRAAPFRSLQFSIVLPLSEVLTIEGQDTSKRPIRLLVDGQAVEDVRLVEVRDSGRRISLLRDPTLTFVDKLAKKFIGDSGS